MLKVITVPNPTLTQPTKPVKKIDQKIKRLIKEMEETLIAQKDPEGVGLAAPQVGISLSLFIIKPNKKKPIKVFINPKIIKTENPPSPKTKKEKTKTRYKLEGCLSIPRIWGSVKRAKKVLLQYQNEKGEQKKDWFSGFEALIIQHEMDHLRGVLFTQRTFEQKTPLYQEKDGKLVKLSL